MTSTISKLRYYLRSMLSPVKRVFIWTRKLYLAIKGIPFGDRIAWDRFSARISLLESKVNWRLLGLPAPLGQIQTEFAGGIKDRGELSEIIELLAKDVSPDTKFDDYFSKLYINASAVIVVSTSNIRSILNQKTSETVTYLLDPEDLSMKYCDDLLKAKGIDCLKVTPRNFLASSPARSIDFIWLGDSLLRTHPLAALLTLKLAHRSLRQGGKIITVDKNIFCLNTFRPENIDLVNKYRSLI